jgi:hypothetical protein
MSHSSLPSRISFFCDVILARTSVYLFLKLQERREDVDDLLTDRIAILDEVHAGTGNQKVDDTVRKADRLFAAQSHVGALLSGG